MKCQRLNGSEVLSKDNEFIHGPASWPESSWKVSFWVWAVWFVFNVLLTDCVVVQAQFLIFLLAFVMLLIGSCEIIDVDFFSASCLIWNESGCLCISSHWATLFFLEDLVFCDTKPLIEHYFLWHFYFFQLHDHVLFRILFCYVKVRYNGDAL